MLGAVGGTWWTGRLQTERDKVEYQRRLQDERRERLRLLYRDALHQILLANRLAQDMTSVAYGRMGLFGIVNRHQAQRRLKRLQALQEQIEGQAILLDLEENVFDAPVLLHNWNADATQFVATLNTLKVTRSRWLGMAWYLPPDRSTLPALEAQVRSMGQDYRAVSAAARAHLEKLSAPIGEARKLQLVQASATTEPRSELAASEPKLLGAGSSETKKS